MGVIHRNSNNSINVVILDIDLKSKVSGLDLANMIRKKDKNVYKIVNIFLLRGIYFLLNDI